MVARLQYAATWVHFDISFTVAQLLVARLCASAGPTHWAALHHVIEYLAKHSSLKFGCRKITSTPKGLDGFCANADWVNSSDLMALQTTENDIPVECGGRALCCIRWSYSRLPALYIRGLLINTGFDPDA